MYVKKKSHLTKFDVKISPSGILRNYECVPIKSNFKTLYTIFLTVLGILKIS